MTNNIGLLRVQRANEALNEASQLEPPRELYKSLIFEGEISIIMADTNVGKSIFAVQVANMIAATNRVAYIDSELGLKQFEHRYSNNYKNHYAFSENFFRVDFSRRFDIPKGKKYEEYFIESLIELVTQHKITVLIIDNMTTLASSDTDSAQNAKPIMDRLCALKHEYGLTLILVEHTRKINKIRAVTLDDLQGSKMKANYADSVIAIGRSYLDENIRYVKQLKCRSAEIEYCADNVLLYELCKDDNFLCFKHIGQDMEYKHIKAVADSSVREDRFERIKDLKSKDMSLRAIGRELGLSEGCIRKTIKWGENLEQTKPKEEDSSTL